MTELSDARMLVLILYTGAIALVVIGLFAMVTHYHIVRILLGLSILEAGVNLMLVAGGFRAEAVAPILTQTQMTAMTMVDPIPQALILTAIVIGVGVLALALALSMNVYRSYGTLDTRKLATLIAMEQGAADETELLNDKPATGNADFPEIVKGRMI